VRPWPSSPSRRPSGASELIGGFADVRGEMQSDGSGRRDAVVAAAADPRPADLRRAFADAVTVARVIECEPGASWETILATSGLPARRAWAGLLLGVRLGAVRAEAFERGQGAKNRQEVCG
jgi:hypothetical protein